MPALPTVALAPPIAPDSEHARTLDALECYRGNQTLATRMLGIARSTRLTRSCYEQTRPLGYPRVDRASANRRERLAG